MKKVVVVAPKVEKEEILRACCATAGTRMKVAATPESKKGPSSGAGRGSSRPGTRG